MKLFKSALYSTLLIFAASCGSDDDVSTPGGGNDPEFVGAVYAMTNGEGQVPGNVQGPNRIIAYGRSADGSLTPIRPFDTNGNGGDYDGGQKQMITKIYLL